MLPHCMRAISSHYYFLERHKIIGQSKARRRRMIVYQMTYLPRIRRRRRAGTSIIYAHHVGSHRAHEIPWPTVERG